MTAESIHYNPPRPDYERVFGGSLSQEQIAASDQVYNLVNFWLPDGTRPETITMADRKGFAFAVHECFHSQNLTRLPTTLVSSHLEDYYRQFPPGDTDLVHEQQKLAHQNTYIAWACKNIRRCPEAQLARNLAIAYRAAELPDATASMYALLTAYGTAVQILPSQRGTPRQY